MNVSYWAKAVEGGRSGIGSDFGLDLSSHLRRISSENGSFTALDPTVLELDLETAARTAIQVLELFQL
jgi:hypothetical protein